MKSIPILLALAFISVQTLSAETLNEEDRSKLLETLQKIKSGSDAKLNSRYRTAMGAFQQAMSSPEAALDLYIKCHEKINFEEQHKKAADFRAWKDKNAAGLNDPQFRQALRIQLRWLCLSLEAASPTADRNRLSQQAKDVVDSIFTNADELKGQQGLLNESVMSTIFARTYGIAGTKIEDWPLEPLNLPSIYDKLIFPTLRKSKATSELQAAWLKRIQQETIINDRMVDLNTQDENGKAVIGMAKNMKSPEAEKFLIEEVPRLQWEMETDLFEHGDEKNAAARMLMLIQKHLSHKDATKWTEELEKRVHHKKKPEQNTTPPADTNSDGLFDMGNSTPKDTSETATEDDTKK